MAAPRDGGMGPSFAGAGLNPNRGLRLRCPGPIQTEIKSASESTNKLLRELVAHLRQHRTQP
jgi:hypothetical protein